MKKKFEILMVACLFISAFLLARASAALTSSRHAASSKTCIVLDAGHGGSDPGKVGCNDALEKDINLSIVLKLKTLFENKGASIRTVFRMPLSPVHRCFTSNSLRKVLQLPQSCRIP